MYVYFHTCTYACIPQITQLQPSLCPPKQASPLPEKHLKVPQWQKWWAPNRCSCPTPPTRPPLLSRSTCPPGRRTWSPSRHPRRPGRCPTGCSGWSWWSATRTRRSDRVLGKERFPHRARGFPGERPARPLFLETGRKDDHMMESLMIILFDRINWILIKRDHRKKGIFSICLPTISQHHLEMKTSGEHIQCFVAVLRQPLSGDSHCRLPEKYST